MSCTQRDFDRAFNRYLNFESLILNRVTKPEFIFDNNDPVKVIFILNKVLNHLGFLPKEKDMSRALGIYLHRKYHSYTFQCITSYIDSKTSTNHVIIYINFRERAGSVLEDIKQKILNYAIKHMIFEPEWRQSEDLPASYWVSDLAGYFTFDHLHRDFQEIIYYRYYKDQYENIRGRNIYGNSDLAFENLRFYSEKLDDLINK